jgi:hypothetical protein
MTAPQPTDRSGISRRALLRGGSALGLSALASGWLASPRALASLAPAIRRPVQQPPTAASSPRLVANYQPSQPTGWPPLGLAHPRKGIGVTLGGHTSSQQFTFQGNPYQISLLSFDQPGTSPDPVYESVPSDPTINFKDVLQKAYSAYYTFRYTGGFNGQGEINVQSYTVLAIAASINSVSHVSYGADLYFVYEPDLAAGDPPISDDLQWIQVAYASEARSMVRDEVDNVGRANPYYFGGGITSIYGTRLCNFYDAPDNGVASKSPITLSDLRMYETFLAHDTGRKDRAGKGIVDIYGGIKWGWEVQAAQS